MYIYIYTDILYMPCLIEPVGEKNNEEELCNFLAAARLQQKRTTRTTRAAISQTDAKGLTN